VTDGSSTATTDDRSERQPADDRPDRAPVTGLVDALGVVDHAKRGLAVGVALAAAVFGFFVVLPLVDPGTPARPESPVLYVALAFVVATAATLLVASALAVRAVAGRVMDYAKWTRRGAVVAAVGGAWWAATGALAFAVTVDVAPASVEPLVLATLPLPVLVLAVGAWSALARTGGTGGDGTAGFDHVRARPRIANAGAMLALVGIAAVHTATFLQTDAFLGAPPENVTGAGFLVGGALALAFGTATLASVVHRTTTGRTLTIAASALAGASLGLAGLVATEPFLTPIALLVLPGLAWLALGVVVARDPGTYPERPI
jgi:drug/metabolite transporter (DMT)-like permease